VRALSPNRRYFKQGLSIPRFLPLATLLCDILGMPAPVGILSASSPHTRDGGVPGSGYGGKTAALVIRTVSAVGFDGPDEAYPYGRTLIDGPGQEAAGRIIDDATAALLRR
jgi:hypothetical protein